MLNRDSADILYGNMPVLTSVSRLETFARCPFAYFARYNLRAAERRIYELADADAGRLLHDSLRRIFDKINAADWQSADGAELKRISAAAVEESLDADERGVYKSGARYAYFAERAKRAAESSVAALAGHLRSGDFEPVFTEYAFEDESPRPLPDGGAMLIRGRVDRADVAEINGAKYVKVIDYKTGGVTFSYPYVYFGLSLQLLIYLDTLVNALRRRGEPAKPAAALYFRLPDPIVDFDRLKTGEQPEHAVFRSFRMTGVADSDPDVLRCLDREYGSRSDVLPVTVKKDGTLASSSTALDSGSLGRLLAFARNKAAEAAARARSGDIAQNPFRRGEYKACAYCDCRALCDPDGREWNTCAISAQDALFAMIGADSILNYE